MKKYFVIIISFISIHSVYSSEVDSFQFRYTPLEDSSKIINHEANRLFKIAVEKSNKKKGCKEKKLYKNISRLFKNHYQDKFSKFVYYAPNVHRRTIEIRQSIYKDFTLSESFIIGGLGRLYEIAGSIVRMGPYLIGTDKLEHLFGRGYAYFKKYYLRNKSLENVFKFGIKSEIGILGARMTGVMSYADLAANFKGLIFWNHILKKREDVFVMKKDLGPYVVCENKKWKIVKQFDIVEYIDDAWDEAINCSKFKTKRMVEKVKYQLSKMEEKDKKQYQCPVDQNKLHYLKQKYNNLSKWFINFDGHIALD